MWRYRLLLALLFIPLLGFTFWQAVRNQQWRYFWQRLGLHFPGVKPHGIWIHAASVGEVNAVTPLLQAIRQAAPELPITLTSNTITSAAICQQRFADQVQHIYLPLDYRWAMRQLINKLQPRCVLIVETELWPNLYAALAARTIPIVIVNGRLSSKTLNAAPWLQAIYKLTLNKLSLVLARSSQDQQNFMRLGLAADRIRVLGNLKFAAADSTPPTAIALGRPYLLAASTRDDEEWRIIKAWQASAAKDLLLVIVPRHPQRLNEILREISPLVGQIAVRSKQMPVNAATQVYIADTIGELAQFIAGAQLVIMGGSFVARGGQNILEPARAGKPLLFGPSMENFYDEAQLLLEHQAARQLQSTEQLAECLTELFNQPQRLQQLGQNAHQVMQSAADIVPAYLQQLQRYFN